MEIGRRVKCRKRGNWEVKRKIERWMDLLKREGLKFVYYICTNIWVLMHKYMYLWLIISSREHSGLDYLYTYIYIRSYLI